MADEALRMSHIVKIYPNGVMANKDVTLSVDLGEIHALSGENGAGKSTLYRTTHYQDTMPRINTDEILRGFGDWRNTADLMKAGRIAIE